MASLTEILLLHQHHLSSMLKAMANMMMIWVDTGITFHESKKLGTKSDFCSDFFDRTIHFSCPYRPTQNMELERRMSQQSQSKYFSRNILLLK